ncbi:McrB family protein [Clostridium intestinale]|uniref:AAA domain (Dynein-related subfamily) n=1 Tax=Clostridium intestinale DSM 6191 TaxID=1121320 RepID=A0A1M5WPN0_9CLOT|nr:AAA family ATPase [Clostridium intestinale]SHH89468.1 AAA domain (dynein-related subfamily) [Clostridium intestinale DSM 6191]
MTMSQENKNKLIRSNQCYMVGVLAENEQFYPSGDEQKAVTTLKNSNSVIFYIKPLSIDPEPVVELIDPDIVNPLYIGIDNSQSSWLIPYTYQLTQNLDQKKQMIYDKLKDKLIVFRPKINFTHKELSDKPYKNAVVVNVESDIKVDEDTEFITIPIVEISNSEFQKKIVEGSSIILSNYSQQMYPPEHIMCNNYIYFNFPEWTKSSDGTGWICEKFDNRIKRVKIDIENSEMDGKIIEVSGVQVIFIEKNALYNLEKNGKVESLTDPIMGEIILNKNNESTESEGNEINVKESMFIDDFKEFTLRNNLCYSKEDLINLHTCVKTNPLTILSGMSGTGKSELATAYAKMLKCSEQLDTLLFLPISPSFTEPGDLLGYLNNATGLFIPSETGLSEFLLHAKDNPNSMHVVVFDEMNLSQVEYWFSPFISLLERKPEDRRLFLYNPSTHCINKQSYPPSIIIKDNVKFIGTVNTDETTKDFSDRLLDRANIINLKKENLVKFQKEVKELKNIKMEDKDFSRCASEEEYQSWTVKRNWSEAYTDEEIKFLDDLHSLLNEVDNQKGVSFRITKKIAEYLLNIPSNLDGTKTILKREAFDLQIKQRLITKIKGAEKKYGKLIGTIKDSESKEPTNSNLYEFFSSEEAVRISDFKVTKKEIIRKARELGVYGYAN